MWLVQHKGSAPAGQAVEEWKGHTACKEYPQGSQGWLIPSPAENWLELQLKVLGNIDPCIYLT